MTHDEWKKWLRQFQHRDQCFGVLIAADSCNEFASLNLDRLAEKLQEMSNDTR